MSEALVFVPGIMGTELHMPDGEQIWPPTPWETITGYGKIAQLQSPDLQVGKIIANVSCVKLYQPIQDYFKQMGFTPGGTKDLVEFPYDWRLDLFDLADHLASRLDGVTAQDIKLVAHSMGGLVTRLMLESGKYDDRPWFSRISLFTALATPHNGAPLALARILGLDSTLGISAADFAKLARNPAYPSGYQLLPAPGEDACWDQSSPGLEALDIYDTNVSVTLNMVPALVERAAAVHEVLTPGKRPKHIRYFYFAGAGQDTVTRINVVDDGAGSYPQDYMSMTKTRDAGDGTVPMWSALPRREQKQVVVNTHVDVFRGRPFQRVFFRLFGIDMGPALEAAAPDVQLNVDKHVYTKDEPITVMLHGEEPLSDVTGKFVLTKIDETGAPIAGADPAVVAAVTDANSNTPHLTVRIGPLKDHGHYRLSFEGDLVPEDEPVFSVMQ